MRFVIVTGMSGAGKSQALKVLEDFGFNCVANMPLQLLENYAELVLEKADETNVALGIDVRNSQDIEDFIIKLDSDALKKLSPDVLFIDASNECLMKRYKETRRNHPLENETGSIEAGINLERKILGAVKSTAKYVIDTTFLLTKELRNQLDDIILQGTAYKNLNVTIMSFGFKYGLPSEADLVFDVRFLPNPFYVDELKELTGNDKRVSDYVKNSEVTKEFLQKLTEMIKFLLPNYVEEGKNQLVIAIGCTGGKHRSVTVANELYNSLEGMGYGLKLEHRQI